jgi:flagellin-like hook-associated protein FlgL
VHSQIKTELRGIDSVISEINKVKGDVGTIQTSLDTENEKLKNDIKANRKLY